MKDGDTIISTVRPNLKSYAYVKQPPKNLIVSTGFAVIRPTESYKKYYYYYTTSDQYVDYLVSNTTGSAYPAVNINTIKDSNVLVPNRVEAERIGDILSVFDDKIELNNEMNKTLAEMAQAIFRHWLIGFEFPNENGQPYKSSGGEFEDSELGPIPKGWNVRQIKDICKDNVAITGKTPLTRIKDNYGDYMLFITIPDMHGNVFITDSQKKLSAKGVMSQENKTLPPLSICVSCIATPGLVCLTSQLSQTNQQINSIICRKGISPYYVYFLMKNRREQIINLGSGGTATLNLNKGDFERIRIILPNSVAMEQYDEKTRHIFDSILLRQRENQILCRLRDTLLPKLISGEIRVM